MAHRTQITLTDDQYRRLVSLSRHSGLSLSELVRRALERTYARSGAEALAESFGAWKQHSLDGEAFVERVRQGLAVRLEDADGRAG